MTKTVTTCDICGKEIDGKVIVCSQDSYKEIVRYEYVSHWENKRLDVCDSCMSAFVQYAKRAIKQMAKESED